MTQVEVFAFNPFEENTYVVFDDSGACAIFDPGCYEAHDRRLMQLKIEREAVRKDEDQSSRQRLEKIEDEIGVLEREFAALEEVWKGEKAAVQGSQQVKSDLEQARNAIRAVR